MPVALAAAYLTLNFAIMVWLERERAAGRNPASRVTVLSNVLRYGPPLLGAVYLVTLAGDWLFVLFVLAFFGTSSWLMNGVLAYTEPRRGSEPMRNLDGEDWNPGASSGTDRDRSA